MNANTLKNLLAVLDENLLESTVLKEDGSILVWLGSDSDGGRDYLSLEPYADTELICVHTRFIVCQSKLAVLVSKLTGEPLPTFVWLDAETYWNAVSEGDRVLLLDISTGRLVGGIVGNGHNGSMLEDESTDFSYLDIHRFDFMLLGGMINEVELT